MKPRIGVTDISIAVGDYLVGAEGKWRHTVRNPDAIVLEILTRAGGITEFRYLPKSAFRN